MAYIGNTVQNQGFAPAVDYFNGDGTTVTFTLSRPVASVAQLTAVIENVIQNPSTAFTVSGSSITFTSAPPSGTNNIWVEYTSLITTYAAISQDPTVIGDITATGGYSATGDYGNSFVDGVIMDYVTGNARITTGASDGITLYNGGTSARSALMAITSAGNVGIGTTSPYNNAAFASLGIGGSSSGKTGLISLVTSAGADSAHIDVYNSQLRVTTNGTSNPIVFYTGGSVTEAMRIDSSGYVTMPYQPVFQAFKTTNTSINSYIVYDSVWVNVGSFYNASNGRFTAPVTGVYQFSYGSIGADTIGTYRITIHVNGSEYNTAGTTGAQARAQTANTGSYPTANKTIFISLTANDYVQMYFNGPVALYGDNSGYTHFSGRLMN